MTDMELQAAATVLADLKVEAERTRNWLIVSQITEVARWLDKRLEVEVAA